MACGGCQERRAEIARIAAKVGTSSLSIVPLSVEALLAPYRVVMV